MFEGMSENEARAAILDAVREYHRKFRTEEKPFKKGDPIKYAGRVYDENELVNGVDSVLEFWLTAGRYTAEMEKALCDYLGVKFAALTNSGSSANLAAFAALTSPLIEKERRVFPGDEVITTAAAFPTTIAPVVQFGAVPVFVDITIPGYNIDVSMLEKALSAKTKAVFVAHTLGNPFDLGEVKAFCDRHGLWLIEDNCDALGSEYTLGGVTRKTGSFGDIGTSSFYPAHHITTGEGGAVYTNDPLLHRAVLSMRDWGRDCRCPGGRDNVCGHRYDGKYGELPEGYDHKYVYSHLGYNLKLTDIQAAIGCAQMKKLPSFAERRRSNFRLLYDMLSEVSDTLILPEETENSRASWFGFPITVGEGVSRGDIVKALEESGVQTRMLFSGNIIRHPCFDEMRGTGKGYRVIGGLPVTDRVMRDTFWVGVYPGMTREMLAYTAEIIIDAVRRGKGTR